MVKITCPNCGEQIELGKDAYNSLLSEIESQELDKKVNEKVDLIKKRLEAEVKLATSNAKTAQDNEINRLKAEKAVLEEQVKNVENVVKLAVSEATQDLQEQLAQKNNDIVVLKGDIQDAQQKAEEEKKTLEGNYKFLLEAKEEEVKRWKEFRMGDSTKDLGESLETYCSDAFNQIRADAYPNAYFEKDTKSVSGEDEESGTKGDYIFRDFSPDGIELVSIMFDMKTEKDNTKDKKTNEYHLKKLNGDREKKGCEYAVLVSTLEADSNLYNRGIVDMSHRYPKTFVVRPQFFTTIIGLIRNMALKSYEYKKLVVEYQRENVDVTNFEQAVRAVTSKISNDYDQASTHYDNAEKLIDGMIKSLTKLKEEYRLGKKWIGAAQNAIPELEVRRLVKDNPTMKEKFDALKEEQ